MNRFIVTVILVFILGGYGLMILQSPLPMNIIDRDASGFISLLEALDSLDVGQRKVVINNIVFYDKLT